MDEELVAPSPAAAHAAPVAPQAAGAEPPAAPQAPAEPVLLADENGWVPLRFGDSIRTVHPEDVDKALAGGWKTVSPEEAKEEAALADYKREASYAQQTAEGFLTGAVGSLLSVPAGAVAALTGTEQSGHKWLSEMMASENMSQEEAETRLRHIAEVAPLAHFVGEAGAMVLATKGVGAAAGAAGAGVKTTKAIHTTENVLSSIALANEQAYLDDRELTVEVMAAAGAMGGFGPIVLGTAGAGLAAGGKKLAGKLDDMRMGKFRAAIGAQEEALQGALKKPRAAVGKAVAKDKAAHQASEDALFAREQAAGVEMGAAATARKEEAEKLASDVGRAQAKFDKLDELLRSEGTAKLREQIAKKEADLGRLGGKEKAALDYEKRVNEKLEADMARAAERLRLSGRGGGDNDRARLALDKAKAAQGLGPDARKLGSVRESVSKAEQELAALREKLESYKPSTSRILGARAALDDAIAKQKAGVNGARQAAARAEYDAVTAARTGRPDFAPDLEMAARKNVFDTEDAFRRANPKPSEPARFSDLFAARDKRVGAMGKFADEAADTLEGAERAFQKAGRRGVNFVGKAHRAAHRERGFVGEAGSAFAGAGAGFMAGGLGGAMMGGLGGLALGAFGPAASGAALRQGAKWFRGRAVSAANQAMQQGARKAVTPLDMLLGASRAGFALAQGGYRARVSLIFDQHRQHVDRMASDPLALADSVGANYGGFSVADPSLVGAIAQHQANAIGYLKGAMPGTELLHPAMPQLGKKSIPIGEQEAFLRKVRAVQDPSVLLDDLGGGHLHRDTVDAVKSVYPILFLDLQSEVLGAMSSGGRSINRAQAQALDTLLGGRGMVYGASNPGFQARLALAAEVQGARAEGGGSAPPKRPAGGQTLSQSMKTGSQQASESIGNS